MKCLLDVSNIARDRIVANQYCGLSYRSIDSGVGQDPMTICKIQNGWVYGGATECGAVYLWPIITKHRKDRYLTHTALMDRTAMSQPVTS